MAEAVRTRPSTERASSIYSSVLEKPVEVARVLKVFRDQRAELKLRFEGDANTYTAKILDVGHDLRKGAFLIEDIQPRVGISQLRQGRSFTFSGRTEGLYVNCDTARVSKVESERGIPYFRIDLPSSLLCQQRRRAARFHLPLRVAANDASVTLFRKADPNTPLVGEIIDISAGGCRAVFPGPFSPTVEADEVLISCAVNIPNLLELSSQAIIRHFSYNKKSNGFTCGIELAEMHVTDRRRLEQFIQSIARVSDQV